MKAFDKVFFGSRKEVKDQIQQLSIDRGFKVTMVPNAKLADKKGYCLLLLHCSQFGSSYIDKMQENCPFLLEYRV